MLVLELLDDEGRRRAEREKDYGSCCCNCGNVPNGSMLDTVYDTTAGLQPRITVKLLQVRRSCCSNGRNSHRGVDMVDEEKEEGGGWKRPLKSERTTRNEEEDERIIGVEMDFHNLIRSTLSSLKFKCLSQPRLLHLLLQCIPLCDADR